MQDAQSRIGVAKMKEMFERIPTIKLPYSLIPIEFMEGNLADYGKKSRKAKKRIRPKIS